MGYLGDSNAIYQKKYIYVHNTFGQVVYNTATIKNTVNIDLSGKSPGVYLVRLLCNSKIYSNKIIKQ